MRGTLYGAGVGPGDPELMTLKTVRLIRENTVIAVPGRTAEESAAYRIAVQAVPELAHKTLLPLYLPMVRDRAQMETEHRRGAARLKAYLDRGENVVFLTIGDPSIYSTFGWLTRILRADGYTVETAAGVPSFCAAAARLGIPLTEWDEALHVIPAAHPMEGEALREPGTYVLMKSGGRMKELRDLLRQSGREAAAVTDCGMETEAVYRELAELPESAGYFTLIISRQA